MAKEKAAADEKGGAKKGGKLKLIIIILVVLALLGGGGFAAWKFFLQAKPEPEATEESAADEKPKAVPKEKAAKGEEKEKPKEAVERGPVVNLPPFVVNLADPVGRRYLKASMDLEVVDATVEAEITANLPRIKDSILLLLSSKAFADIDSLDKKLELKDEVVARVNQILGKGKVINLYFTEFVIQ